MYGNCILCFLDFGEIDTKLDGTIKKSLRRDSTGRQSRIITIEYNVEG